MSRRFSNPCSSQRVTVTLVRDGFGQPWGFRLAGGKDVDMPLTILRAKAGTPSEGELRPGDVVCKIGDRDAKNLTHDQAQKMFRNAGNTISVVLERGGVTNKPAPMTPPILDPLAALPKAPVAGGVATPFAVAGIQQSPSLAPSNYSPLKVNTTPAPLTNHSVLSPKSPGVNHFSKPLPSPSQLPVTVFPPPLPGFVPTSGQPRRPMTPNTFALSEGMEAPENIDNQPYRTTPLVLPGAKNKREVPITSYLRHHPNPAVRAAPNHYDQVDVVMKQKVADTVLERVAGPDAANKKVIHQFNSPIGLYSDQNIVDSVQAAHTGVTPNNARVRFATLPTPTRKPATIPSYKGKKTLYYDPAKSETFKALKDSELGDTITEVPTPIQPKIFTPQKHIQPPLNQMQRPQAPRSPQPANNYYPLADEKIHQSYSFRRLMNEVLGESEF